MAFNELDDGDGTQRSIAWHARNVSRSFLRAAQSLEVGHVNAAESTAEEREDMASAIDESYARFRMWAGNMGAMQPADRSESLDYRLREEIDGTKRICDILWELATTLESVNATIKGMLSEDNNHNPKPDQHETDELIAELLDLETSSKCTSAWIQASVADLVGRLFKLSLRIEKSTTRDRYARAEARFGPLFPDMFDLAYVNDKFGGAKTCKAEQWLLRRLGKAITKRRMFLKYSRDHQEKLVRHVEDHESKAPTRAASNAPSMKHAQSVPNHVELSAPSIEQTTASTLAKIDFSTPQTGFDDDEERSVFSEATSVGDGPLANRRRVISLIDVANLGEPFECPYCCKIQRFNGQISWKKHVFADLRAYVCTFKECGMLMFTSKAAWIDHEMEAHRRWWSCHICNATPFSSKSELMNHLEKLHQKPDDAATNALMAATSTQMTQIPMSDCALCRWSPVTEHGASKSPDDVVWTVPYRKFMKHLGAHLEELALFAVPIDCNGEDYTVGSDDAARAESSGRSHEVASSVQSSLATVNLHSEMETEEGSRHREHTGLSHTHKLNNDPKLFQSYADDCLDLVSNVRRYSNISMRFSQYRSPIESELLIIERLFRHMHAFYRGYELIQEDLGLILLLYLTASQAIRAAVDRIETLDEDIAQNPVLYHRAFLESVDCSGRFSCIVDSLEHCVKALDGRGYDMPPSVRSRIHRQANAEKKALGRFLSRVQSHGMVSQTPLAPLIRPSDVDCCPWVKPELIQSLKTRLHQNWDRYYRWRPDTPEYRDAIVDICRQGEEIMLLRGSASIVSAIRDFSWVAALPESADLAETRDNNNNVVDLTSTASMQKPRSTVGSSESQEDNTDNFTDYFSLGPTGVPHGRGIPNQPSEALPDSSVDNFRPVDRDTFRGELAARSAAHEKSRDNGKLLADWLGNAPELANSGTQRTAPDVEAPSIEEGTNIKDGDMTTERLSPAILDPDHPMSDTGGETNASDETLHSLEVEPSYRPDPDSLLKDSNPGDVSRNYAVRKQSRYPLIMQKNFRVDDEGVLWITLHRESGEKWSVLKFEIRGDIEKVDVDGQDIIAKPSLYKTPPQLLLTDTSGDPRVALPRQVQWNRIGWALANLNPILLSSRSLTRSAVYMWRLYNEEHVSLDMPVPYSGGATIRKSRRVLSGGASTLRQTSLRHRTQCDRCRSRKRYCSFNSNSKLCTPCLRAGVTCTFTDSKTKTRRINDQLADDMHNADVESYDANNGLCPIPTCGRHVKDLKAHMLTHENERPEKCPIVTCEYHVKGFGRKYDQNRHSLTHFKGTMVCDFCPGSGSTAEKSFNRVDVFKRHLTTVHGVQQTPPNLRSSSEVKKKGRAVPGVCSTCRVNFADAQDFYEHLDDCVLRIVRQAHPIEFVDQKLDQSGAEDV